MHEHRCIVSRHTAPLKFVVVRGARHSRRSPDPALTSLEPASSHVCLPDTHNSRASLTHEGGLARSSGVPLSLATCPLLVLDAADQTRVSRWFRASGCHLIEAPCVNTRSLRSRPPLRGTLQGRHCARYCLWPIGSHGDGWSHVIVLSHGDVYSLGEGLN